MIHPTVALAIRFGAPLLLIDACAWCMASSMFDRERLILGTRSRRKAAAATSER